MRLLAEARSLLGEEAAPWLLAAIVMNLGAYVSRDDPSHATALYEEALAIRRGIGDRLGIALCLLNLGVRAEAAGDLELAQARLDEATAIVSEFDAPLYRAIALVGLGDVARARGDLTAAGNHYRESLGLFVGHGDARGLTTALLRLAWLAWTGGQAERAARLYGAANELSPGVAAGDSQSAMHDAAREALRRELGDDRFAVAYEVGRRLSVAAAAAEAAAPL